jgi:hypothetical protein
LAVKNFVTRALMGMLAISLTTSMLAGEARAQNAVLETEHFTLATNLSREQAKEAYVRLDRMFEQFEADFAWLSKRDDTNVDPDKPRPKFRAVLHTNREVYLRAGGLPFADGAYVPKEKALLVFFNDATDWYTVVHEGAHQYVAEVIGGDWPAFFNEGLATYYGYALFGGDGYLPGHVSKHFVRMNREIATKRQLVPFDRLFAMTQAEWNKLYRIELYHQSWTYVHYMLHSDSGNLRAFRRFVQGLADGEKAADAWRAAVPDQRAFMEGWNRYWGQASVENEKEWRQRQIVLLTAAGISRVNATYGKKVQEVQAYFRACQSKQIELKETPETWLPMTMLLSAAAERDQTGKWSLDYDREGMPVVRLERRDAPTLEARYDRVGDEHRARVVVIEKPR